MLTKIAKYSVHVMQEGHCRFNQNLRVAQHPILTRFLQIIHKIILKSIHNEASRGGGGTQHIRNIYSH